MKLSAIKDRSAFAKVLKQFGFIRIPGDYTNVYSNDSKGWYAEILDRGNYCDVWATGKGLKTTSGCQGGWVYSSVEELEKELKIASK